MAADGALAGKGAIVTGAGQGVGRGVATALALAGAKVLLVGRTPEKLEAVRAEIEERGGTARSFAGDIATGGFVEESIAAAAGTFGGIGILVNNAISQPLGALGEVTDEAFEYGFRTGPLAALRYMRGCYPYLRGDGSIVNVGSGVSNQPSFPGLGCYAAVKDATRTLGRAAAGEWGPDNIRVNTILPLAMTPPMAGFMAANPEVAAMMLGKIPLGRMGDPETDIGSVVVFLCSEQARYITGATLTVDGGQDYVR